MKFAHYTVMALGFVITASAAQPQSPADAQREQRAAQREFHYGDLRDQNPAQPQWDRHERDRQWREQRHYCRDWRERVERHPRLVLPRECWR